MTITTGAALVVLILGIIAIIIALTRESPVSSVFFFWTAAWVTMLAYLGGVFIR